MLFEVQKKCREYGFKSFLKTKNGRTMLSSKCVICRNKKSRFMKKQEVKGILSGLGLKTP